MATKQTGNTATNGTKAPPAKPAAAAKKTTRKAASPAAAKTAPPKPRAKPAPRGAVAKVTDAVSSQASGLVAAAGKATRSAGARTASIAKAARNVPTPDSTLVAVGVAAAVGVVIGGWLAFLGRERIAEAAESLLTEVGKRLPRQSD